MFFINITLLSEQYIDDIVKLWNENFKLAYHVTNQMIRNKIFHDRDTFYEGSFILLDKGRLAGLIVSKVNRGTLSEYNDCAWISTLVVDRKYQKLGFGKELLDRTEKELYRYGIEKITIGADFDNFFSGIPDPSIQTLGFFGQRGYILNNDEHYDLSADISKTNFDDMKIDMNKSEEYFTCELTREQTDKLSCFFDETFPGRWKTEVFDYLERGGDLRNVLILWNNDRIVGFCKIFISDGKDDLAASRGENWGSLGPIGINGDIRGKGLGNRILNDSLKFLQKRGARNVIIDWTILKDFYGQFGFNPLRTYRGAYKLRHD
ncbi:MAG: GCN5-related N-acetyltransferase [Eubacterium sp.]|nr:GCN5-related N-acetyltransferase [Eubacterium sp.]